MFRYVDLVRINSRAHQSNSTAASGQLEILRYEVAPISRELTPKMRIRFSGALVTIRI